MDTHDNQASAEAAPSVRESLVAAMAQVSEAVPPANDTPAVAATDPTPAAASDTGRDDKGRFAPKQDAVAAQPVTTQPVEADKPAATASTDGPPVSWKPEARELYAKADPALQAYIRQREAEQQQGVAKLKAELEPKARFADEVWSSMAPYADMIRAEGGTPAAAVRDLLETAAIFRRGTPAQKQQALVQIASQFGVPLPGAATPPTQQAPAFDPAMIAQHVEQRVLTTVQQREQTARLQAQIEAFAKDRPHFQQLAPTMGKLIEAGIAADLDDAYDRAMRLDPELFAKTQAEQSAKAEAEKRAKAEQDAAKKRAAGVSVTGAPGLAGVPANGRTPAPTLRAELERAFQGGRA